MNTNNIIAAIHQPHYFPWIPYVNKIASVDIFILFDTVQLPRGKSRMLRAKYLHPGGEKWLSFPYGKKGELNQIKDAKCNDFSWKKEHVEKLRNAYYKAPHAEWALELVNDALFPDESCYFVDIAQKIINKICEVLEIKTRFVRASDLTPYKGYTIQEYLVALLDAVKATCYLSGKGGGSQKSIDESLFQSKGIALTYQDYLIPPYQHHNGSDFIPSVSILDALFTFGEKAKYHVYQPKASEIKKD
jgi:hypothetical protein